ncbi:MAG: hypothetical protein LUQ40_02665, partial [Methanomicrobiales archaeon]|nr:hypothetical protein [Methanomicrobiales archaeon]
ICFGLTSGIITTLGLMTGLEAGTNSKLAVLGGIVTIAIADAFSDALGIHVSEESENRHTGREIWESTAGTFIAKFLTASSFAIPVIFLDLRAAVYVSIVWGLLLLSALSIYLAREQKKNAWKVVAEHVCIAVIVIVAAYFIGLWISATFI